MSNPRHKKLQMMSHTDMSSKRSYTRFSVEESRMAFKLETYMVDFRVNMLTRYNRDLKYKDCQPADVNASPSQNFSPSQHYSISLRPNRDQDHLELCPAFTHLWKDLGSYDLLSRVRYFLRLKVARLKQQKKQKKK